MTAKTIRERFETIIKEQLGVKDDDLKQFKNLEDLGGDSLDEVEILMALEEEFEIEISDDDATATEGDLEKMLVALEKEIALDSV